MGRYKYGISLKKALNTLNVKKGSLRPERT